jgi:hypothetical protein
MRTLRELPPSSYDTQELYGDYLEHASEGKNGFAKGGHCLNRPVAPVGAACGLLPRGSSLRNEEYSDC